MQTATLKSLLGFSLRIIVSFSLLAWLLSQIDLQAILQQWQDVNWLYLCPTLLGIHLLCTTLRSLRLRIILENFGIGVSLLWLCLANLKTNFLLTTLPGNLAGDVYRTWLLTHASKQAPGPISSILVERIFGAVSMGCVSLSSLFYGAFVLHHPVLVPLVWPMLLLVSFLALGALSFSWIIRKYLLNRAKPTTKLGERIQQAITQTAAILSTGQRLSKILGLSFLFQLAVVTFYFAIARALGMELSFLILLLTIPLTELILLLPISIGGIGLRETVFSVLLPPFGLTIEEAVSFSLLCFTLLTVTKILSGLAFIPKCDPRFAEERK